MALLQADLFILQLQQIHQVSHVHVKKNQNFYLLPVRYGKIFVFFDMMLHLVLMIP